MCVYTSVTRPYSGALFVCVFLCVCHLPQRLRHRVLGRQEGLQVLGLLRPRLAGGVHARRAWKPARNGNA